REGGMKGKYGVPRRQHAVDGMAEFMGHRGDIARFTREVQQHVWGHVRHDAVTIGASDFPWSRARVNMTFVHYPFSQLSELWRKASVAVEHHSDGLLITIGFLLHAMRRIDVVATHRLNFAQAGLDAEIVLKDANVFPTDFQETCHSVIWNVVPEVAGGNRGSKPAQLKILCFPVIDQGLVDFAKQVMLIGVNTVELSIGRLAQSSLRMAEIGREFLARH